ncbi:hypothetical protein HPB50_018755 [Hyalomma asiaticum]|uniref:Uncharacterized protein n=1 Tax=Hyalomma asiaticum TaxID=266040 RepID=A0ACB7S7I1_HYAAI|nr:hypothetical protein HPB50_018755 [Hyalomma asiaticum]
MKETEANDGATPRSRQDEACVVMRFLRIQRESREFPFKRPTETAPRDTNVPNHEASAPKRQRALRSSRRTAQSRTVETEATATRALLRCFPGVLRTTRTLAASPFGTVCRGFGARVSREIKRKKVERAVAAAIELETLIAFAYFPVTVCPILLLLSARQCILALMSHMENSTARSLYKNWFGTT